MICTFQSRLSLAFFLAGASHAGTSPTFYSLELFPAAAPIPSRMESAMIESGKRRSWNATPTIKETKTK
jgi:hypothetical protein